MHFMNPVPVMELIEIIRALQTDDQTCDVTCQLALALGKTPLLANDSPGFVANRILVPNDQRGDLHAVRRDCHRGGD